MEPTLHPYLTFNGNAAEAMKFYHAVLGGELNMQTFEEAKMSPAPEYKDKIVHSSLKNDALTLMASDSQMGMPVNFGNNVSLSVGGSDLEKLTKVFDGLSEGGKVTMPLAKQFWGDTFGMVTDKFGVHWMVNVSAQQQG